MDLKHLIIDVGPRPGPAFSAAKISPVIASTSSDAASPTTPTVSRPFKRKRLLRACQACHKSKRRCDGQAPCQNCQFAEKRCFYLDTNGVEIPPPVQGLIRTRKEVARNFFMQEPADHLHEKRIDLPLEPRLVRELVNLFFATIIPFNYMFHRPTFLHQLSLGRVPAYLLNAIFSVTAHLSLSTNIPNPPHTPLGRNGVIFYERAVADLFDLDGLLIKRPGEELEVAQALIIVVVSGTQLRLSSRDSIKHWTLALEILEKIQIEDLAVHEDRRSSSDSGSSSPPDRATAQSRVPSTPMSPCQRAANWQRLECIRRTLWILHFIHQLAASFTWSPANYRAPDVQIYLPTDEGDFDLGIVDDSQRECLTPIPSNSNSESHISELGHLLRMTFLYTEIIAFASAERQRLKNASTSVIDKDSLARVDEQLRGLEASLSHWEDSLPVRLRFDESTMLDRLNNRPDYGISDGNWAYAFMHSLCCCSRIVLCSIHEFFPPSPFREKRLTAREVAYARLVTVLEVFGQRGRYGLLFTIFLGVLDIYLSSAPDSSSPSRCKDAVTLALETELEETWSLSRSELFSTEFIAKWILPVLHVKQPIRTELTHSERF